MRKLVHKNSMEMEILRRMKGWTKKELRYFVPYESCISLTDKDFHLVTFPEKSKCVLKNEAKCMKQIGKAIETLHKRGILHMDVHLENIVMDRYRFYLVDFGISQVYEKKNLFQWYHYCFNEDYFQLLWNMYFHSNRMVDDFRSFRMILCQLSKKKYDKLCGLFRKSKTYAEPVHKAIFSMLRLLRGKEFKFHSKNEKILGKFILMRLYFFHVLLSKEQNTRNQLFLNQL